MNKSYAVLKISRPGNFTITFIAVVIAALISTDNPEFTTILLGALSISFACSAGNIINDIYDLEIDRINRPNRVLPSGMLSVDTAKILYGLFLTISIGLSGCNGLKSVLFVIIVNATLYFYSVRLKHIPLLGNFIVSLLTFSALIYGAMIAGNVYAGIIPGVFAFFTNFIREIIKDIEDVKGDEANNINTFPNLYGINKSIILIHIITINLILLTTVPFLLKIYKIEYFILVMPVVNGLFVYMLRSIREDKTPGNLHKLSGLVKLNMIIGIIAIYLGNT